MLKYIAYSFIITVFSFISYYPIYDQYSFFSEILSQYVIQISSVIFISGIYFLYKKKAFISFICITMFLINVIILFLSMPVQIKQNKIKYLSKNVLRVFSYNMYISNENFDESYSIIKNSNADIVLLLEVNPVFLKKYDHKLLEKFPYKLPKENNVFSSNIIYSRNPILNDNLFKNIPNTNQHVINAEILYESTVVNFIGVHALSPKSENRIEYRNKYFQLLKTYINTELKEKPIIVAGDMNSAPWRYALKSFILETKLQNTDSLYSLTLSWPTWLPIFLQVPIDNIFFSEDFCLLSKGRKEVTGSDHYPIFADFMLCNKD